MTRASSPSPGPNSLAQFILGPRFLRAPFGRKAPGASGELKFEDASAPFPPAARLTVFQKGSKLLGLDLSFDELAQAPSAALFDWLDTALSTALGSPKKAKKSTSYEEYAARWWVIDLSLCLARREAPTPEEPVCSVTVRAFPIDGLALSERREAGVR